jgi:hypothetical protein
MKLSYAACCVSSLWFVAACDGKDEQPVDASATLNDASTSFDASALLDANLDGARADADVWPTTYFPNATDFNGFHDWISMPAVAPPGSPTGPHALGPMTLYIKKLPPKGSTAFPAGTLIVKETQETDVTKRQTFALAKRGGDYNAAGAKGWEWFQFTNRVDGTVFQRWRGLGPPPVDATGDTDCTGYGGDPEVCNGCHEAASGNDYVYTIGLTLKDL